MGGGYLRLTVILITRGFFRFAPCWPITNERLIPHSMHTPPYRSLQRLASVSNQLPYPYSTPLSTSTIFTSHWSFEPHQHNDFFNISFSDGDGSS